MNKPNPDMGEFLAYREYLVTVAQKEQIDQILAKVAKNQQRKINKLQRQLDEKAEQIFGKIRVHAQKLSHYGNDIEWMIDSHHLKTLQKKKTISELALKRYCIADAKCRKVLEQQPGPEKSESFRKFTNEVLFQAVDEYFRQLSQICDALFLRIELQRLESLKKLFV